ncbi:uncharacterized protein LOC135926646 [Gordionus sp. m RMFG-2023]|uniref:uncharacterized protein LOC135926646 n=1 Tax=Gordionus sp. m RMFG-2023 TaxID=3053472 RepID=UPI0031FD602B
MYINANYKLTETTDIKQRQRFLYKSEELDQRYYNCSEHYLEDSVSRTFAPRRNRVPLRQQVLRSPRPYWWVHVTDYYVKATSIFPHLRHFPITCETGPGNPSGHMMVSTAVYLGLVYYLCYKSTNFCSPGKRQYFRLIAYTLFAMILVGIGLSRLYIAAHFPHQLLFGMIGGIAAWYIATFFYCPRLTTCALLPLSGLVLYHSLHLLDLKPDHSIHMAFKYCALRSFVNFNTNPLVSLARSVGTLLGLCISSLLNVTNKSGCLTNSYKMCEDVGKNGHLEQEEKENDILDQNYRMYKNNGNHVNEHSYRRKKYGSIWERFDNFPFKHFRANLLNINKSLFSYQDLVNDRRISPHQSYQLIRHIVGLILSVTVGLLYFFSPSPVLPTWPHAVYIFTLLKFASFTLIISGLIPKL